MTPSEQAKATGLKSLKQVSDISGVSVETLSNWHKNKQALFRIVLMGCWIQESYGKPSIKTQA